MKIVRLILILTSFLLLAACGAGSKAPAVGSPEWLWGAARESYAAGDYEKTSEHLRKIEKQGANPFVERARAWRLLIEAGSANAQWELAKAYADGWEKTRTERTAFAKRKSEHLNEAKRHAIELFEGYSDFLKTVSDKPVPLEFPFPQGSAALVADLDRVYKGMPVSEEVSAGADDKMMKRGLVRAVGSVLATEEDSAKAQTQFKDGRAEVPPARFLTAMAVTLNRVSVVFDRKNLNEPDKQKLFQQKALDTIKQVAELKPDADTEAAAKKLKADIDKQVKERAKGKRT